MAAGQVVPEKVFEGLGYALEALAGAEDENPVYLVEIVYGGAAPGVAFGLEVQSLEY